MKKVLGFILFVCVNLSIVSAQELGADVETSTVVSTRTESLTPTAGDGTATKEGQEVGGTGGEVNDLGSRINDGTVSLNDIPLLILYWVNLIMKFVGTIAVMMLVWGGFLFMLSGVTEQKEEAKNTIKWAIVGVITASLAWVIVNTLQVFLTS